MMITVSDEAVLSSIYNHVITMCKDSNNYVMILIKLMEKKILWAPYIIDRVTVTFGLQGSSYSEANHDSVKYFYSTHRGYTWYNARVDEEIEITNEDKL